MFRGGAPRHSWTVFAIAAVVSGLSSAAWADEAALAETLYQQGRTAMAAGQTDRACEKFAESHRLDPATGTLLNLAACRETQQRFASAWAHFNAAEVAARRDGRADRVRYARDRLAAIEPRLSYLTVEVPVDSRVADLDVRLDSTRIRESAWGVATPVDPGPHQVSATAPGKPAFQENIEIPGQPVRISVQVRFASLAVQNEAPVVEVQGNRSAKGTSTTPISTLTLVAGGIGAVGLVVGAIYGLKTFSTSDKRNSHCPMDMCSPRGLELEQQARRSATVANVAFVVGAVGVATGAALWFSGTW